MPWWLYHNVLKVEGESGNPCAADTRPGALEPSLLIQFGHCSGGVQHFFTGPLNKHRFCLCSGGGQWESHQVPWEEIPASLLMAAHPSLNLIASLSFISEAYSSFF